MFNWLFGSKKEVEELKEEVRDSFERVKSDVGDVTKWIKHLDEEDSKQEFKFSDLYDRLASIEKDIEGIKNTISLMDMDVFKQLFKTNKQLFNKQAGVQAVQTGVQTGVQTAEIANLTMFSVMERALIYVLLNSDMKLSYDDLAAMLGKSRATIRGQVNSIKQKSEALIEEIIERNGKKRVFIPEIVREKLLKNVKVRVNKTEKTRKKER